MEGDPYRLSPYRVEWRANLGAHWQLMGHADTHEEALGGVADVLRKHGGQARAITQHVIEAKGLGA